MNLRTWRKHSSTTLGSLAGEVASSKGYLSDIERGKRRPSPELAKRIEAATNGEVTAAELLGLAASSVRETPREFEHASTLNVELNEKDLKDAAKFGLDAEAIARRAVEEKVKAARLKAWVSENKSAFDAHAKDVEENGLWSDGLRQF